MVIDDNDGSSAPAIDRLTMTDAAFYDKCECVIRIPLRAQILQRYCTATHGRTYTEVVTTHEVSFLTTSKSLLCA